MSHAKAVSDNTSGYAWNDVVGWVSFESNVEVTDSKITGYADIAQVSENLGLDCNTVPNSPDCGTAGNWFVSNDSNGNLAGWGWNKKIGWVSFCGNTSGGSTHNGTTWECPSSPTYEVTIDGVTGDFSGWAWNDVVGWISFSCSNTGTCATSDYVVNTGWRSNATTDGSLESSTIDTCPSESNCSANLNTIMWQGDANGATVSFQIASSNNSTGPWTFYGPNGDTGTYYSPSGPNEPSIKITREHANKRYIRYKVFFNRISGSPSPVVRDVILNISP